MKLIWCFVLAVSLFKDYAEGSCLSYGHSCWGAHGKRSDPSISANNGQNRLMKSLSLSGIGGGGGMNSNDGGRSPSNRWALVKIIPRNRNIIYAAEDSQGPVGAPIENYVPRGLQGYKMKMKLNANRGGEDGQQLITDSEKMIRRKLISEEQQQQLLNDSDLDASEPISDEDATYINVMKQI